MKTIKEHILEFTDGEPILHIELYGDWNDANPENVHWDEAEDKLNFIPGSISDYPRFNVETKTHIIWSTKLNGNAALFIAKNDVPIGAVGGVPGRVEVIYKFP